MVNLTPEELASGEWVWDSEVGDFVNINAPLPEPEPKEEPTEIPTHAITGMRWNGNKLS